MQDVATRVIAEGLKPHETSVSKVMTRNPIFVMGDTLAVEALQKMVQGAVIFLALTLSSYAVQLSHVICILVQNFHALQVFYSFLIYRVFVVVHIYFFSVLTCLTPVESVWLVQSHALVHDKV